MKKNNVDRLAFSWLPWLHIEYHNDEFYSELMALDINKPSDQETIIELAILPNFTACDAITGKALLELLDHLPDYPEADVREVLSSAGPLTEKLQDYRAFFEKVRARCEALQAQAPTPER